MGIYFQQKLKVEPNEYNIMLTEAPLNPKNNREKMAQIMFENFNAPTLYIAIQAVLSLYSAGKFTGIVADSGEGVTHFVPIFDGFSLPHAVLRLDLAGEDLTEFMVNLITEIGKRFSNTAEKEIVKDIKEKSCYVALNFEEELKKVEPFKYELPDGSQIIIGNQRIRCPEMLFNPYIFGKEGNGIGQSCYESIQKCDIDIKKDLYNNIVLSGGSSMFEGLPERLTKEIKNLAPESMKDLVKVLAPPKRQFAVWNGGTIISSISTFKSM